MISNSGIARSTASHAPPTIIERLASRAPLSPPETGASIAEMPLAAASVARLRASDGVLVVISIRSDGGFEVESVPWGPRWISSTSAGKPTIEIATSRSRAASAAESAHFAPCPNRSAAFSRVRVCTVRSWPAASRCPAIDLPMTPVPINPIFMRLHSYAADRRRSSEIAKPDRPLIRFWIEKAHADTG